MFLLVALFAVASLGVIAALQVRQAAQRTTTANEFRSLALALQNYSSANSTLPKPVYFDRNKPKVALYSWRYRIIPFVASYKMDVGFDLPWDHPANSRWRGVPQPYAFGGWGDGAWDTRRPGEIPTETRVYAITGPDTAFGDGETYQPNSLGDLPDDIILVTEIRDSGHHWMKNGDFDIRTMPKFINSKDGKSISGRHDNGFYVIFADGEVWFLANETPFSKLSLFFTIDGAMEHDRDDILGKYR